MNILLTGASGFLGRALEKNLSSNAKVNLSISLRTSIAGMEAENIHVIGDIEASTDWTSATSGQSVVIHTAARAHVMNEKIVDPLSEYRRVNVAGTLSLAKQAAEAGVKRFLFLSSIKVNGESTNKGFKFSSFDKPSPSDPYGQSKWEAEEGLLQISRKTGMEVVIIRSPLIYGWGVKGNFSSMVKLIRLGVPLPLGAVHNLRTLVGIDNLVDLIIRCIDHPAVGNKVILAGDGQDISTTELLQAIGQAMGRPARLIPVPVRILQFGANIFGNKDLVQRLLGSLQVDISQTCELLAWTPPYTLKEGLDFCFASRK